MSEENERWMPIKGYEGLYEVSSNGRVKSLEKNIGHRIKGTTYVKAEKILKPSMDALGYLHVRLADLRRRHEANQGP